MPNTNVLIFLLYPTAPNRVKGDVPIAPLVFLDLIDHSDGPRWAFDILVSKKTMMVCDVPLEVMHENQSNCLASGRS